MGAYSRGRICKNNSLGGGLLGGGRLFKDLRYKYTRITVSCVYDVRGKCWLVSKNMNFSSCTIEKVVFTFNKQ